MTIVFLLLAGLFTALFYFAPGWVLRTLARKPFRYTFTPENTFCAVVTEEELGDNGSERDTNHGGNLVKVLHGITGKSIDMSKSSPMDWEVVDVPDLAHDAFLYRIYGIQDMGSIWHTTRLNTDRRMRFARDDGKPDQELHTLTKARKTRHVFYTGELTVVIKEADTEDKLGVNFEIDFAFARRYPIRSILKLADSAAFLTSLVENAVNSATVGLPAGAFIGGVGTGTTQSTLDNRKDLVEHIEGNRDLSQKILDVIGLDITSVSLRSVSMTEKHRALLELEVQARKTAEAQMIAVRNQAEQAVITAEADKKAKMLRNDADADRIERVVKPAAENELTVAVKVAEAYENNKTVTTYAPGAGTMVPLGK